jgi:hypothetical protein
MEGFEFAQRAIAAREAAANQEGLEWAQTPAANKATGLVASNHLCFPPDDEVPDFDIEVGASALTAKYIFGASGVCESMALGGERRSTATPHQRVSSLEYSGAMPEQHVTNGPGKGMLESLRSNGGFQQGSARSSPRGASADRATIRFTRADGQDSPHVLTVTSQADVLEGSGFTSIADALTAHDSKHLTLANPSFSVPIDTAQIPADQTLMYPSYFPDRPTVKVDSAPHAAASRIEVCIDSSTYVMPAHFGIVEPGVFR